MIAFYKKILLVSLLGFFGILDAYSQDSELEQIKNLFSKIADVSTETEQLKMAKEAEIKLVSFLKDWDKEEWPNIEIPHLGKVDSENGLMTIYSWNVPREGEGNHYFCVLHYKASKNKEARVLRLIDHSDDIQATRKLDPKQWYGALYYAVHNYKCKKKTCYVIMGWDGHNSLVNRKIVDVITVAKNGSVSIGAPVFQSGRRFDNRVVFEYSAEVGMMLQYDSNNEMIVFDRLAPREDRYKGFFEYYSPSFVYDGYRLKKGKWWFQSDLDLKNAE